MRKLKFDNPEELEEKITRYFDEIAKAEKPPTLSGLALFLGTTRQTLFEYIESVKGGGSSTKAQCGEKLVMAKARIECYLEEELVTRGKTHGIEFALTNGYAGWGNKTSVKVEGKTEVEHKEQAASRLTDEELMDRLAVLMEKAAQIRKREGL